MGGGGGGTYFWRQSLLEFCGYHSLSDCTVSLVHLASPQTSFGVRLSRIHFSTTDIVHGGEMNA